MPRMSSKLARMDPRRDAWTIRISFLVRAMLYDVRSAVSWGHEVCLMQPRVVDVLPSLGTLGIVEK